jgi:plastocyanin
MQRKLGAWALAVALVVSACGGPSAALGYDKAPTNLDPNSPKVSANQIAFDRTELAVPAIAAFILVFENQESVPHNISIYSDAAHQHRVFEGVVFDGPATRWYPVSGLAPGTYFFQCDVHPIPSMAGVIVAR